MSPWIKREFDDARTHLIDKRDDLCATCQRTRHAIPHECDAPPGTPGHRTCHPFVEPERLIDAEHIEVGQSVVVTGTSAYGQTTRSLSAKPCARPDCAQPEGSVIHSVNGPASVVALDGGVLPRHVYQPGTLPNLWAIYTNLCNLSGGPASGSMYDDWARRRRAQADIVRQEIDRLTREEAAADRLEMGKTLAAVYTRLREHSPDGPPCGADRIIEDVLDMLTGDKR